MVAEHSRDRAKGITWIIALVVLCLGVLGYGAIYATNSVSNTAFLTGKNLVYALVLGGAFHVVFLRKHESRISLGAFAAIFLALMAGDLLSASINRQRTLQSLNSIQQELHRMEAIVVDPDGLQSQVAPSAAGPFAAGGEVGEMERFVKESLDASLKFRKDYMNEIEAIGWSAILDAKRIKNDVALSESKDMIARAKAIAGKYENKNLALLEESRKRVDSLNISEKSKKEMLAGIDQTMTNSRKVLDEQWRLEKEVLRQFENIVQLLAASKAWTVKGENILFNKDDELARFNTYMTAIKDLGQQQEKNAKAQFTKATKRLEEVRDSVRKQAR